MAMFKEKRGSMKHWIVKVLHFTIIHSFLWKEFRDFNIYSNTSHSCFSGKIQVLNIAWKEREKEMTVERGKKSCVSSLLHAPEREN